MPAFLDDAKGGDYCKYAELKDMTLSIRPIGVSRPRRAHKTDPLGVIGVFSNRDLEIDVDRGRIGQQRMRRGMIGLRGKYLYGD